MRWPEAYVLAGELAEAGGNHETAFACYEERMRVFVRGKQDTGRHLASSFAPETEVRIILRNLATRLMVIPFVADALIGRDLRDNSRLPDYARLKPSRQNGYASNEAAL